MDTLDIEQHIINWAMAMHNATKTKEQAKIHEDNFELDINWKRTHFKHGEPDYQSDQLILSEPKTNVIFTTTFVNDTKEEHEYSFKTERSTKSTCEIEMSRGVTTGTHVGLSLKTPCEVFEAHAGFSRELQVCKTEGEIIEKELIWSVDSQIKLTPQTKTFAKLVVDEQEFKSKFKVMTTFWGKVIVTFLNRADNNNYVRSIEGELCEIFRGKKGFTVDSKRIVTVVSEGVCHFRYGINQQVHLQQQPLPDNNCNVLTVDKNIR